MEQEQWRAALSAVFVRMFDFFFFRPLVLIYQVDLPVPAGLEKKKCLQTSKYLRQSTTQRTFGVGMQDCENTQTKG